VIEANATLSGQVINVRSAKTWLLIACSVLLPWHWWCVSQDPWFRLPPKPVGDGPDYENIAFQLSRGAGWSIDWTDADWRAAYLDVAESLPQSAAHPESVPVDTSRTASAVKSSGYAAQLERTDGWTPTTARPPLLPALIAMAYRMVGRGPHGFAMTRWILATSLALAGALAVAMTVQLAQRLTSRAGFISLAALATLALACLDRTVRTYATDFLTEPVAMLLLQLWLWCVGGMLGIWFVGPSSTASALRERRCRTLATIAGCLLGLLIYTRSLMVLWLPGLWLVIACYGWALSRVESQGSRQLCLQYWLLATRMLLVCLLVCLPWWLRNCWVLGSGWPLGTQGSISLLGGYSDEAMAAHGEWQVAPEERLRSQLALTGRTAGLTLVAREVLVAAEAGRASRAWAWQHAWQLPLLALERAMTEWSPYTGRALLWKLTAVCGLILLACRAPAAAWLLLGVLLVNTCTVMLLYSVGGRFLVPCYGVLYTLAGLGVLVIVQIWPLGARGDYWTSCPQAADTSEPIE